MCSRHRVVCGRTVPEPRQMANVIFLWSWDKSFGQSNNRQMLYLSGWEGSISSYCWRIQLPFVSNASCSKALCPALRHRIAAQKVWLWTAKEAQLTPTPQKGTQQWILCQPAASCTLQRTAWGCLLNNVRLWFKGMMVVCLQRNQRTNEESPC